MSIDVPQPLPGPAPAQPEYDSGPGCTFPAKQEKGKQELADEMVQRFFGGAPRSKL